MSGTTLQPLSIFDMDRTITRTGTFAPWLIYWAWREAPWRLALVPATLVNGACYLAGLIDRARLKELNHSLLMGDAVPRAAVERRAAEFAAQIIARDSYKGALAQIAAERAEGRRIVLATASYAFYVEAIGAALGITDIVATGSVWDRDLLRPRLSGDNCYGEAKRRMVEAWLAEHGLTGAPMRFWSDHISDVPMFELANEQFATCASKPLRREAARRGWNIVDWT